MKILGIGLLAAAILGCSAAGNRVASPWIETMDFELRASAGLNCMNRLPHALLVKILQLRDATPLTRISGDYEALVGLLESESTDAEILHTRELVLRPQQHLRVHIRRLAKARYLGLIAGYFEPRNPAAMYRLYDLRSDAGTISGAEDEIRYVARVDLFLGERGIESSGAGDASCR